MQTLCPKRSWLPSKGEERYLEVGYSSQGRLLIVSYIERQEQIRILAHDAPCAKKGGTVKKTKPAAPLVFEADSPILDEGDMRPEYDFSQLQQVGERGRHAKAMHQGYTTVIHHKDGTREVTHYRPLPGAVHLAPDVQAYFPDAEAVNTALRRLIALIPARRRATRKTRQQAQKDTISKEGKQVS